MLVSRASWKVMTRVTSPCSASMKAWLSTMPVDGENSAAVRSAVCAGLSGLGIELDPGRNAAARGESLISPGIAAKVLQRVRATSAQPEIAEAIRSELSDREIEVLKLIADGNTNKEIARILSRSINTVESHRKHVMEKLDLHSRTELIKFALQQGVIRVD